MKEDAQELIIQEIRQLILNKYKGFRPIENVKDYEWYDVEDFQVTIRKSKSGEKQQFNNYSINIAFDVN